MPLMLKTVNAYQHSAPNKGSLRYAALCNHNNNQMVFLNMEKGFLGFCSLKYMTQFEIKFTQSEVTGKVWSIILLDSVKNIFHQSQCQVKFFIAWKGVLKNVFYHIFLFSF